MRSALSSNWFRFTSSRPRVDCTSKQTKKEKGEVRISHQQSLVFWGTARKIAAKPHRTLHWLEGHLLHHLAGPHKADPEDELLLG